MKIKITLYLLLFLILFSCDTSAYTVKANNDHMCVEQRFLFSFSTIEATDNGIYFEVSPERKRSIRIAVNNIPTGSCEPGERYLVHYDNKHEVRLSLSKDSSIRFFPLVDGREGFLVQSRLNDRSAGLPLEKTYGILLGKDEADSDGKPYEIVNADFDENGIPLPYVLSIETKLDENGRPIFSTNVISGTSTQPSQKLAQERMATEVNSGIDSNSSSVQTQTNVGVVQTDSVSAKSEQQTPVTKSSNSWKLLFPIIGVLLVAFFAVFKFKKR